MHGCALLYNPSVYSYAQIPFHPNPSRYDCSFGSSWSGMYIRIQQITKIKLALSSVRECQRSDQMRCGYKELDGKMGPHIKTHATEFLSTFFVFF
uniref:Uncharacterized protein n=1 Tax=Arundo donax TaxID=35708 RepID=A0A0A8ZGY0_ARUDO